MCSEEFFHKCVMKNSWTCDRQVRIYHLICSMKLNFLHDFSACREHYISTTIYRIQIKFYLQPTCSNAHSSQRKDANPGGRTILQYLVFDNFLGGETVIQVYQLRDGDKMRNFIKHDDGTTVFCDKVDGITVISNLVTHPCNLEIVTLSALF